MAAGEVRLRLILHRSAGEGRNDELNECPGELERVIGNSSSEDELGRSDARKYSLWSASSRSDVDGFGDGDLNTSSDGDGYSSEDNLGRSNDRKYSEWSPLDKQRLSAYKKEGKSWEWIFSKFPGRTQGAVRTRWSTMQPNAKYLTFRRVARQLFWDSTDTCDHGREGHFLNLHRNRNYRHMAFVHLQRSLEVYG